MEIDNTNMVTVREDKTEGVASYQRYYMGGFDTVSVQTVTNAASGTNCIDDIYVAGGIIIPEPATVLMLFLGLCGLAFIHRRYR